MSSHTLTPILILISAAMLGGCSLFSKQEAEIKLNNATAMPAKVNPGQTVKVRGEYALSVPEATSTADVEEYFVLKKSNKVLFAAPPNVASHPSGAYVTEAAIPVPGGAEPGAYEVEVMVKSGPSLDQRSAMFQVETAGKPARKGKPRQSRRGR